MTYLRKPGAGLDERDDNGTHSDELLHHESEDETARAPRARLGELAWRFGRWWQGVDPEPSDGETVEHDILAELDGDAEVDEEGGTVEGQSAADGPPPRFALVRYGYDQAEVEQVLRELEGALAARERELAEVREQEKPPVSITEEIERVGEQTASILVVAHDQAHETTRRAQEQAEQCIADAAANAVSITAEAKERLRALDDETDAVWRERERLLEDTRAVSERLASLVDEAISRFPADAEKPAGPAYG